MSKHETPKYIKEMPEEIRKREHLGRFWCYPDDRNYFRVDKLVDEGRSLQILCRKMTMSKKIDMRSGPTDRFIRNQPVCGISRKICRGPLDRRTKDMRTEEEVADQAFRNRLGI